MKIQYLFFVFTLILTACKKDRSCECTITNTSTGGNTVSSTKTIVYTKITKSKAKDVCLRYSNSNTTSEYVTGCELK